MLSALAILRTSSRVFRMDYLELPRVFSVIQSSFFCNRQHAIELFTMRHTEMAALF